MLVRHYDHSSGVDYENLIWEEEAAFLRNLYHKHKRGLRITNTLADKIKNLEEKKLIWRTEGKFILSVLAQKAEYTMVPRVLSLESSEDP